MKFLGKKPARPNAVKFRFVDYVDFGKITIPASFGHYETINSWGMLGNDKVGNCYWAGSDHEEMVWNGEGNIPVSFSEETAIADYSAQTGYSPLKPNSDQGTDVQEGAAYRQKVGLVDSQGKRHKIAAYLALDPGNFHQHLVACYLFGAVGIGIQIPKSAEDQFDDKQIWDVVPNSPSEGGHYVPMVGFDKNILVVTWGSLQPMTEKFLQTYNDESICYLSDEMLINGKSPEGFSLEQLQEDLNSIDTA